MFGNRRYPLWLFVTTLTAALVWPVLAQDEAADDIPRIVGGAAERVTVDVVVLDKDGNPVTTLAQDDFSVFDEGQPRPIASFERIDTMATVEKATLGPSEPPRVVTNKGASKRRERNFVVLFDDLHLQPTRTKDARGAVKKFLEEGAVDGDRVTLIATSGTVWWSTSIPQGREDLIALLDRLEGQRLLDGTMDRISDYEAIQIYQYHDARIAARVEDRFLRYRTRETLDDPEVLERLKSFDNTYQRGVIDPYVESRAIEAYRVLKARMDATLAATERAMRALDQDPGRKTLLLVSEGFVEDPSSQSGFKRVIETARRVNAAMYFIDAAGLRTLSTGAAEVARSLEERDTLTNAADLRAEGEGATTLALDTGGFAIRSSNDLGAGIVRIARESRSYYLIGYDPGDIPRNGKFRKIKVTVNGDYTVRARRGYYAPSEDGKPPEKKDDEEEVDPAIQHALDAPGNLDEVPLRMTAYALGEVDEEGRSRVLVVADVDLAQVQFREVGDASVATLDTLTMVAHRDSDGVERADQQVEIKRKRDASGDGPIWYSFMRELFVPSGRQQARLVVRDAATLKVGSLIYDFEVPPADTLRVSTPVLTDAITRSAEGDLIPTLLARRTFATDNPFFCRFDVYGAKKGPDGKPVVMASQSLRRKGGEVLGSAPASVIAPTEDGDVFRFVQIPLGGAEPGDYELVLSVRDQISGESRELVEPFSVVVGTGGRSRL